MKISSDFNDFYDLIQGEGQDQSIIYNRYKKISIEQDTPFSGFHWLGRGTLDELIDIHSYVIGFCGSIYPLLELSVWTGSNRISAYCYNLHDVETFVKKHKSKEYNDWCVVGHKNNGHRRNHWPWYFRRSGFESFFNNCEKYKNSSVVQKFFKDHTDPIFVITDQPSEIKKRWHSNIEYKISYNCSLKDLEFYRIFDSYRAFQEINMWINNQAVPMKPIPQMTDEIKLESKGFDKKYSFRKDATKKK